MYTLRSECTNFSDNIIQLCQDFGNFVRPFPFERVERDFFGLFANFRVE